MSTPWMISRSPLALSWPMSVLAPGSGRGEDDLERGQGHAGSGLGAAG
jgi:hypothetical protein